MWASKYNGSLTTKGIFLILTVVTAMNYSSISTSKDYSEEIALLKAGLYNPFREFNVWINSFLIPASITNHMNEKLGNEIGYYALCYLRDVVAGSFVYWFTAGAWHLVIYNILGNIIFTKKNRPFPKYDVITDQMLLAQSSMFLYAALPVLSEFLIESKFTKCYFYLDEIGGLGYSVIYFILYIAFVEVGIYWMHRTLHTNKFLYKYIHGLHHKYNKASTLTPWASIAFNPLDGILQACPYVIGLFFLPVNYFAHVILLFFTGVWATNIHDSVPADTEPIMGAKYHTYHHTHYHYNFGQFFIFCDYIWGTLKLPNEERSKKKA